MKGIIIQIHWKVLKKTPRKALKRFSPIKLYFCYAYVHIVTFEMVVKL